MQISMRKFGENVRRARERKGMSVEELAMSIRERIQCIERIEAGMAEKELPLEILMSLCMALDTASDELCAGVIVREG